MKPIEIQVTAQGRKSSQEICEEFLDTDRWPEFTGYSILPGIKSAHFEIKTPDIVGSRIRAHNTDGSSHVEEIIEWDPAEWFVLKFQEFSPPVKYFASHFIETWVFQKSAEGTAVVRTMALYPTGFVGRLILRPISKLMRKAFESHMADLFRD